MLLDFLEWNLKLPAGKKLELGWEVGEGGSGRGEGHYRVGNL